MKRPPIQAAWSLALDFLFELSKLYVCFFRVAHCDAYFAVQLD